MGLNGNDREKEEFYGLNVVECRMANVIAESKAAFGEVALAKTGQPEVPNVPDSKGRRLGKAIWYRLPSDAIWIAALNAQVRRRKGEEMSRSALPLFN